MQSQLERSLDAKRRWSREELLVAFKLYCEIPFGQMHSRNPVIIKLAQAIRRSPSSLAMKLTNIASLDPMLRDSGRTGLTGTSKADRAMWEEMSSDWDHFLSVAQKAADDLNINPPYLAPSLEYGRDRHHTDLNPDYEGQTRATTVMARVGQAFFREAVLSAYSYRCCITGVTLRSLLIASHIVPWSKNPKIRLNPRNGVCLSTLHDRAFDSGLITFSEDFRVVLSRDILRLDNEFLNSSLRKYDGMIAEFPEKFSPEPAFLAFHRQEVFRHA